MTNIWLSMKKWHLVPTFDHFSTLELVYIFHMGFFIHQGFCSTFSKAQIMLQIMV
jgi:hypothetical protein